MEHQPKLGEIVSIPLGVDGWISLGSPIFTEGVVVALDADHGGLDVGVGFKLMEMEALTIVPHGATRFDAFVATTWQHHTTTIPNLKDYDLFVWVYHSQLEHRSPSTQSSASSYPQGVSCSKCGEGNPYGEPNQPDGSYKCGVCRR